MRIWLHIGLEPAGAARVQQVLDDKRDNLLGKGILFPRSAGAKNDRKATGTAKSIDSSAGIAAPRTAPIQVAKYHGMQMTEAVPM